METVKKALTDPDLDVKKSAFDSLRAMSRSGNADAMVVVGKCYSEGLGVTKNSKLALLSYQKAAEADSVDGMYQLALSLLDGIGTAKNASSGMDWLKMAAKRDHIQAIGVLADELVAKYQRNQFLGPEMKKWSEFGASRGIASCQRVLGNCHEFGIDTTEDPQLAFYWYSKAAKNGDAFAAVIVALCHIEGTGTTVNESKGVMLLKVAATTSNPNAVYHYAVNLDKHVVAKRSDDPLLDPSE